MHHRTSTYMIEYGPLSNAIVSSQVEKVEKMEKVRFLKSILLVCDI